MQVSKLNRKVTIGKSLTGMAVVIAVLCTVFTMMDVNACRKRNLERYGETAKQQLQLLLEGAEQVTEELPLSDRLLQIIHAAYETNSRAYCFVGRGETLLFVRDEKMTEELYDKSVTDFLGTWEEHAAAEPWVETRKFPDGRVYIVAGVCVEAEEGLLTVAICTGEEYVIKQGDFDVLRQRLFVYLVLTGIAYIASVSFLSGKDVASRKQKSELQKQLVNDRQIIERLGTKLEERSSGELSEAEGGMCSREILDGVLASLTPEQREKSRKMMVYLEKKDMLLLSRVSVLLDRMLKDVSVCSLWDETSFYVLLLNVEDEGAVNFAKQFVLQYQKMFRQDIRNVRIVVGKL